MREINRDEVRSMDTPNLTKMRNVIRDHWTWDTGSDEDKELLDFIETELTGREAASTPSEPYFNVLGDSLRFNDHELISDSYNYSSPLKLGVEFDKAVKKSLVDALRSYAYDPYDINISDAITYRVSEEIEGELKLKLEALIRTTVQSEISFLETRMISMMEQKVEEMKTDSITGGEL